jgi:hypothetical protein
MPFIEAPSNFYLGRYYDPENQAITDEIVYYESRDLTTHAVVVGMTGSGKTGLCITLLEEAIMDGIPSVIIDPKGDITNLMLAFSDLRPENFLPWINAGDAARSGLSPEEYAQDIAQRWREGLDSWGIGPQRIETYRNSARFNIYTPGSDSGMPISILAQMKAPREGWAGGEEFHREHIRALVTAILSMIGMKKVNPVKDREHVLISNIFEYSWRQGRDVTMQDIVLQVQRPPFERLGAFDIETFFPEKERFKLAIELNNIIAAPSFQSWLEGEPLDFQRILFEQTPQGNKPRVNIFYIAHLSDEQRSFIITLILESILAGMRQMRGTSSLRALFYFDEVFGHLPPYPRNPPTKEPLLRLLKQGRAFGIGAVLATQNPGDLDYKGLTNAGTWFIGRLQTENDKKKVLDGLTTASTVNNPLDVDTLNNLISSVEPRVFVMNNVHESGGPRLMHSRWAMSFLSGPLTRQQVSNLMRLEQQARYQQQQRQGQGQWQQQPGQYGQQQPQFQQQQQWGQQQAQNAGMYPQQLAHQQGPNQQAGQPQPPNVPPPGFGGQQQSQAPGYTPPPAPFAASSAPPPPSIPEVPTGGFAGAPPPPSSLPESAPGMQQFQQGQAYQPPTAPYGNNNPPPPPSNTYQPPSAPYSGSGFAPHTPPPAPYGGQQQGGQQNWGNQSAYGQQQFEQQQSQAPWQQQQQPDPFGGTGGYSGGYTPPPAQQPSTPAWEVGNSSQPSQPQSAANPANTGGFNHNASSAMQPAQQAGPPQRQRRYPQGYSESQPVISSQIEEYFLPTIVQFSHAMARYEQEYRRRITEPFGGDLLVYKPFLLAQLQVRYLDRKTGVNTIESFAYHIFDLDRGGLVHWDQHKAAPVVTTNVSHEPFEQNVGWGELPSGLTERTRITALRKEVVDYIYKTAGISLVRNPQLKIHSVPGMSYYDFQSQVVAAAREARDEEIGKVTGKYEKEFERLEDRYRREARELRADEQEFKDLGREEFVTMGEAVLSLLQGRTAYTLSRVTRTRRYKGQAREDISESNEVLRETEQDIQTLQARFERELANINEKWNQIANQIEEFRITPYKKDIHPDLFGVGWMPMYVVEAEGQLVTVPAWSGGQSQGSIGTGGQASAGGGNYAPPQQSAAQLPRGNAPANYNYSNQLGGQDQYTVPQTSQGGPRGNFVGYGQDPGRYDQRRQERYSDDGYRYDNPGDAQDYY